MKIPNNTIRSFFINGLGYVAGAIVGFLFIYLVGRLGLADWLFGLVVEGQFFLQILAVPFIAWFLLALGGAITGGITGWFEESKSSFKVGNFFETQCPH